MPWLRVKTDVRGGSGAAANYDCDDATRSARQVSRSRPSAQSHLEVLFRRRASTRITLHSIALTSVTHYASGIRFNGGLLFGRKRGERGRRAGSEAIMTTFDKREEGFEKQFAHDEELRFKATARRNKLVGLWAAEKLGLSGAEAEAYAKEVVVAALEKSGDDAVFRKIRADFDAKGIAQSDHQIRRTMDEMMAKAVAAVKASG
jgi:hypothetical protein